MTDNQVKTKLNGKANKYCFKESVSVDHIILQYSYTIVLNKGQQFWASI